jgi:kumamolisin
MTTTHTAIPGSERVPLAGAKLLGRASPHVKVEVTLKLRRKKALPELTGRPAQPLSRESLAADYGASDDDINRVVRVMSGFGLSQVDVNPATRTVRLGGTVAALERAFQVRLFNYSHESGNYRGRVGAVHVPNDLAGVVEATFGLDTRRVVRRRPPPVATEARRKTLTVQASWYTPAELGAHYRFPAGDGSGQTVALFEFGGGYFPSDLQAFCKLANVAVPTVQAVSTDGTPTNAKDGAEGEVMLDVEVVAGVCPKSKIVVYFSQWTEQGWISALDALINDHANDPGVVSISWGYAEGADIWTTQAMTQINESFKEAAYLGVTVCAAAGDDGSSDAISDGHAHADFPSTSPYVLAIGGTTIPSKGPDVADIVWKEGDGLRADGGGSTGGGVSAVFQRPAWQSAITIQSVNPGSIVGRVVPDVAANADWNASPYLLVVDGASQPNGGTSAATPLWASLVALINARRPVGQRAGYLTPVLYQAGKNGATVGANGCTDVATGDNSTDPLGGYQAGNGYDAVSGWGVPNGTALLEALP